MDKKRAGPELADAEHDNAELADAERNNANCVLIWLLSNAGFFAVLVALVEGLEPRDIVALASSCRALRGVRLRMLRRARPSIPLALKPKTPHDLRIPLLWGENATAIREGDVLTTVCEFGCLDLAQWLVAAFGLTADDARAAGNRALCVACENGRLGRRAVACRGPWPDGR